jgi:hypothetical protein
MRNIRNLSRIKTLIRHAGFSVKNTPSIDHPIAVAVFYRTKPDGTVGWFWPKGNRQLALSKLSRVSKFFFNLGFETFIADGRLVIYTDLPTATDLRFQFMEIPRA